MNRQCALPGCKQPIANDKRRDTKYHSPACRNVALRRRGAQDRRVHSAEGHLAQVLGALRAAGGADRLEIDYGLMAVAQAQATQNAGYPMVLGAGTEKLSAQRALVDLNLLAIQDDDLELFQNPALLRVGIGVVPRSDDPSVAEIVVLVAAAPQALP